MNPLKNIIQRCHQRRIHPLQSRKTVVTPSTYKGIHHHFTVYCAQRYPIRLYDLEEAGISFMPIGGGPQRDRVPESFGGERFLSRQKIIDWETRLWHTSWGLRVYTGIPSERQGARWHDLEFKHEAICTAPEAVMACIETLVSVVENPLLTLTKSGGLRFSCRIPDYLHPNTQETEPYIYKDTTTPENLHQRDVYLEILGESGHSAWDARYEILCGDLLNPPVIAKGILFAAIDTLRSELHAPQPFVEERRLPNSQALITPEPSLGSYKLNLAKEAFLNRGFTYIKSENNLYHWRGPGRTGNTSDVVLWERDTAVWIRASASDLGIPMQDTFITDVWDDTGILPPITGKHRVSDQILAVREGRSSPLAIKRPSPVLEKPKNRNKVYEPLEKNIGELKKIFHSNTRMIGLVAETDFRCNYEVELALLKNGSVAYNSEFPIVEAAAKHFERQNVGSLARWRPVFYFWDQIKEIPVDVRMANPFQSGNVCEDPERFLALVREGVNSTETLCQGCPVYRTCQERGYLSQSQTLQVAETQLFGIEETYFLDPQDAAVLEKTLQPIENTQRLSILGSMQTERLFIECRLSKNRLQQWAANWQSQALGDFALALLNTLEIETEPDDSVVRRIRRLARAFEQYESEIVRQMCQVNVKGKVVRREVVDNETGAVLADFQIAFESGAFAYIPLDTHAADRLMAKGLQVLELESFGVNKDIRIPMAIEQAIGLGILDMTTVEKISQFPSVYLNPDWTFWHQLKRFLTHYPRDADAPMIWYDKVLQFWVPPVIHPSIKQLLLTSSTFSEQELSKAFPSEEIDFIHINPTPWAAGNQVFQIRSGVYTLKTLFDYDRTWDVIGLSKTGERLLLGIYEEIDRDPSLKHAIVTYLPIVKNFTDLKEKENVCLLNEFQDLNNSEAAFEAADVVWILGTPFWEPGATWRRAQILYGNDTQPLSYEADMEFFNYKDERLQRIYTQGIAELTTGILGRAGFNRLTGKTVVFICSIGIPDITDRPETLLFDWEDFEIAGGLDKLPQTIARRQAFESERDQITAETPRQDVERILGCSSRQANRMLNKLRGGNIPRVTFREQILALLADGEKKAADIVVAIDGNAAAIYHELRRLAEMGQIKKVRWGVYALPDTDANS